MGKFLPIIPAHKPVKIPQNRPHLTNIFRINKAKIAVFYTLDLAFADFFCKFIIEANPKAGGGDQLIRKS